MAKPRNVASQYIPSIYDKDKHPQLLMSLFADGGDVCDFCSDLNIGKNTFFAWLKCHKELADAYEIAKMKAEKWLVNQGRLSMHAENFQANVWSILLRNRAKYTEHRTIPLDFTDCHTPNDKMKKLEKALAAGELTPSEAKYMAEFIKAGAEINEKTEVTKQLDELIELAGKKKR